MQTKLAKQPAVLLVLFLLIILLAPVTADAATCAYCNKKIADNWITVEGKTYHDNHFFCSNCLKPIGAQKFYKDKGRYFDSICFENFVTDKCYYCTRPIMGGFINYESQVYHKDCFNDHIGEKCLVCDEVVIGGGYIDIRGKAVCEKHRSDVLECHSCFSYVKSGFTDGGSRYSDGRIICRHCLAIAVENDNEALAIMAEVKKKLAREGLMIDQEFEISFVSMQELSKQSSNYQDEQMGITRYRNTRMLAGLVSFDDFEIYILSGLPRPQLRAVLAHEMMHVWQFVNVPFLQDLQLCEGSCQYAAYIVSRNDGSKEGQLVTKSIEQHKDFNYGVGFRNVLREVRRRGFDSWLEYLKKNQNPPW